MVIAGNAGVQAFQSRLIAALNAGDQLKMAAQPKNRKLWETCLENSKYI